MEIEQLRNLYLNKIIKHINKVNSELSLYNQSSVQSGGASASMSPTLEPPQLNHTIHNSSNIQAIIILKQKIDAIAREKIELEEKNSALEERNQELLNLQSQKNTDSGGEITRLRGEITRLIAEIDRSKQEIIILKAEIDTSKPEIDRSKAEIDTSKAEFDRLNINLTQANSINELNSRKNNELKSEVDKLNSNIVEISINSITSLYNNNKNLISSYLGNSNHIYNMGTEIIKDIRSINSGYPEPTTFNKKYEESIIYYQEIINESLKASQELIRDFNTSGFKENELQKLKEYLNSQVVKAKQIDDVLFEEYKKLVIEKDKRIPILTSS